MTKLFVVAGGKTQTLEPQSFVNESILQDILEKFPEVIALDELAVSEPFLVIGREVATPAGYIDVLCIDGDGVLTVIETKLARNAQIRREVVGQVLEYVAQVSKWRAQEVVQVANKYFRSCNANTNQNLLDLLYETTGAEQAVEPSSIYDKIDNNLSKGRIKVVIASDSIPDTLRDTVSFINSYSNFDIFVMQVKTYMKDDLQIFAPTIFGLTRKMPPVTDREKNQWDKESFFNALSHLSQDKVDTIKEIHDFSPEIRWGTGKVYGSFSYLAELEGRKITIFSVSTSGDISINFGNLTNIEYNKVMRFKNELNMIKGVDLAEEAVTGGKYPSFSIGLLSGNDSMSIFKSAVEMLTSPQ